MCEQQLLARHLWWNLNFCPDHLVVHARREVAAERSSGQVEGAGGGDECGSYR